MKNLKVIHLIIFFFLIVFFVFLFSIFTKFIRDKKNYEPYEKIKSDGLNILINGDYLTYVNVDGKYVEEGASIYEGGNKISENVIISYYIDDKQVFNIDTRRVNDYVVRYEYDDVIAERIVIVCDKEEPKFNAFETKVITDLEAINYDVNDGILATDNSGKVKISCENSLGIIPGNYSINCKATDPYGNVSAKRKLIKVIEGIKFEYNHKLKIIFPNGKNYNYKYSLDGGNSFIECNQEEILNVGSGSVIATVYVNDELLMSNTYFIK